MRVLMSQPVSFQSMLALFREQAPAIARVFLARTLLLSGLGGMAGFAFAGKLVRPTVRGHFIRRLAAGLMVGVVTVAFLAALTFLTFSPGAFERQPQYDGALEAAPWVVGFVGESLDKLGDLGQQLQKLAANINSLFKRVDELGPLGSPEGDLRLLHVSDLHGNPAGFDFVRQVAASFRVQAVIDTGDITDFGTPIEARILQGLARLGVPYFFVTGNHDSPAVLQALSKLTNVRILNGKEIVFHGLSILGFQDPAGLRSSPDPVDLAELRKLAERIKAGLAQGGDGADHAATKRSGPDILAVHNQRLALELAGWAPVILHGHDHELKVRLIAGSILVDAGTTGASGLRGLATEAGIPYSMAVLYFQRKSPGDGYRLAAIDTIKVYGLKSGFSIDRKLFEAPSPPLDPVTP